MQKIARGMCGAWSVTSASGRLSPPPGARSPEARRSRTVEPSSKATTLSPRTSPARGRSSVAVVNVASLIGAGPYSPARSGRGSPEPSAFADGRERARLASGRAGAALGARVRRPLVAPVLEPLALLVGHLADGERPVVDLLLDAVELELSLLRLALPLRLRRHGGMVTLAAGGPTARRCVAAPARYAHAGLSPRARAPVRQPRPR